MVLVKIGTINKIFQMPDFIQDGDYTTHTYNGSLKRHKTIERILLKIRHWLINSDAMPLYHLLNAFIGIIFGFNCGFPSKDIALYTAWYLKGCKPVAVFYKAS